MLRIRTRLYAAAAKVNIQPTRSKGANSLALQQQGVKWALLGPNGGDAGGS
jgi:hypothetical protein